MAKLLFNATKKQILTAAALATNGAVPVGMGFLHYRGDKDYVAKDMKPYWNGKKSPMNIIDCDYVDGRCVKFSVWDPRHAVYGQESLDRVKRYKYMTGFECKPEYETWYMSYPTYEALLEAAGITDMEVYR